VSNIAAVLKSEICRLARREVRSEVGKTRKAAAQYRRDIAKLKRLVGEQEKQLKRMRCEIRQHEETPAATDGSLDGVRFSARSVKAQRQRLGLSAADYGRLAGVSGLTIYSWEHGKARPRKAQLAALVAVRGVGKREALKRLAELDEQAAKKRPRRKARR
jgi:DNA-binding transcriptional regulator YiaG